MLAIHMAMPMLTGRHMTHMRQPQLHNESDFFSAAKHFTLSFQSFFFCSLFEQSVGEQRRIYT